MEAKMTGYNLPDGMSANDPEALWNQEEGIEDLYDPYDPNDLGAPYERDHEDMLDSELKRAKDGNRTS
jgi:hypothetical protein